jgi:hypothetical protein
VTEDAVADDNPTTATDAASTSAVGEGTVPHPHWQTVLVTIPIVAVVVAGYVANAFWAELIKPGTGHPLWLIALSPINRWLLLTTNQLDAWTYYVVGMARHLFPDPLLYLMGYWYGRSAVRWVCETYPVATKFAGEDGTAIYDPKYRRYLYPLAFVAPNNWVSLLCGATRIPFPTFLVINIAGTLTRLVAVRWVGARFHSQIQSIAEWVGRNSLKFTLGSIVLVVLGIAIQFRRGSGELVGLSHLEDEVTHDT